MYMAPLTVPLIVMSVAMIWDDHVYGPTHSTTHSHERDFELG